MAYASQKPWLLNANLVENITFEMPMIKSRSALPPRKRPRSEGSAENHAEEITLLFSQSRLSRGAASALLPLLPRLPRLPPSAALGPSLHIPSLN